MGMPSGDSPAKAQACAACHGADAKGNPAVGAPNLTDAIWLYGSDKAVIVDGLWNGRAGVNWSAGSAVASASSSVSVLSAWASPADQAPRGRWACGGTDSRATTIRRCPRG